MAIKMVQLLNFHSVRWLETMPAWLWLFLFLATLHRTPLYAADFEFAQPYFESVGDRDAIPGGVVTAMVRDPSGMLWLGTQSGLLRYDGYRFKQFQFNPQNPSGIGGNFITALAAGHGKIWVGTNNDGLSVMDPLSETFQQFRHDPGNPDAISDDSVLSLAVASDAVWVGTAAGLNRFELVNGKFSQFVAARDVPNSANLNRVRSLLIDRQGDLWVGTHGGLRHKSAAALEVSDFQGAGDAFKGQAVMSLFHSADDMLWVGTRQHGLVRMQRDGTGLQRISSTNGAANARMFSDRVQAIVQPNSAQMWVATTVGMHVLDAQTMALQHYYKHDKNVPGSLSFDAIGTLLMDGETLWIGTWGGGLQKVQPNNRAFRTLRLDASGTRGLMMSDVHAVLELDAHQIMIGTGGEGIELIDRKQGSVARLRPQTVPKELGNGLSDGVILALKPASDAFVAAFSNPSAGKGAVIEAVIEADPDSDPDPKLLESAGTSSTFSAGAIWVGTQRSGLFLFVPKISEGKLDYRSGRFTQIGEPGAVSDLLSASDGSLWLGSTQGVARLRAGARIPEVMLDTENRLVIGRINPLVEDRAGQIWAGGADGLRVLLKGETRFKIVKHDDQRPDSLVHNTIFGLLIDREGALWVATEQGIDRLAEPSKIVDVNALVFEHVSAKLGKTGKDVGANLLQDDQGRIWTNAVVIDWGKRWLYELTRADGIDIGTDWTNAHARTADGLLFSGGTEGLLIIDPKLFQPWGFQPPVVATDFRVNGISVALPDPQNPLPTLLSPAQRSFSVEFSALDYSSPQLNRYAYRLQGFDADWISAPAGQRQVSYSNLWPADYLLQVRGSNRVGEWSPHTLRIPIRVLPAVWQTGWFIALLSALVLAMIAGVFKLRTRQISQRAERLEALVRARTKALERVNSELVHSNGALEQAQARLLDTQAKLVFQQKMISLGQLVAGVAHEVNTPLGIAITASSFIQQRSLELARQIEEGSMRKRDLSQYTADTVASGALIASNLQRAAALVRQFKQVSVQAHSERGTAERQRIRLNQFMAAVIERLQLLCTRESVTLNYVASPIDAELDSFCADIEQVMTELVQNALMHAVSASAVLTITVAITRSLDALEISVRDQGSGMDSATIAQVFEPFFTTKRHLGHTGLGLQIAFNLVRARLGGDLRVDSTLGAGSEFVIQVPLRAPSST